VTFSRVDRQPAQHVPLSAAAISKQGSCDMTTDVHRCIAPGTRRWHSRPPPSRAVCRHALHALMVGHVVNAAAARISDKVVLGPWESTLARVVRLL